MNGGTIFSKLLGIVLEDDTYVTTEASQLTRPTEHLCEILQIVKGKKHILNIGDFSLLLVQKVR